MMFSNPMMRKEEGFANKSMQPRNMPEKRASAIQAKESFE
jgi:hypothetical protein